MGPDGGWVRNYPLGYAFEREDVELIVAFRYLAQYPRLGVGALQPLRKRLMRFRKIPPVRAFIAEIDDAEAHAQHFFSRESGGADRPMAKYLDRFDEIRRLQRYIVDRAEREGVAVIENENADRATATVAELVLSAAERVRERV